MDARREVSQLKAAMQRLEEPEVRQQAGKRGSALILGDMLHAACGQPKQLFIIYWQGKVWLVKPGFMNRGRGIEIFDSQKDILSHLAKQRSGSNWVVQKYIERPLLITGRKFDIRAYALVGPDKRVYMYQEGYIRTTCFEYKLENLEDKYIHLTNDAYQKKHEDFGKFEDANKLSFEDFEVRGGAVCLRNMC